MSAITHIKTIEGLIMAAMTQLETIKPELSDAKDDAIRALVDFQNMEIIALRRACE